jgi:hypoxanthine phosphoribosyltransferase
MSLFQKKEFESHSKKNLTWKIECDDLTDSDIETFAYIISKSVTFGKVVGIPRGGLRLAKALEKYTSAGCQDILIVDDVLTTGNSMEKMAESLYKETGRDSFGVVIFSRTDVYPNWIHPIFVYQSEFPQ